MKITLIIIMAGAALFGGSFLKAADIATIEGTTFPPNVTITSSPIVTAILTHPGVINSIGYTGYGFLAQDSSGSIYLYDTLQGSGYTPTVGDSINLSGTFGPDPSIPPVGSFPVITNLNSITVVSTGNTLPTPAKYTIPQLNQTTLPQDIQGYVVELDDVTISGGSGTFSSVNKAYTITDASANSMTMMDWASTLEGDAALAGTPIPAGPVDILGVDSKSLSGSPQFIPYQVTAAPEPASLALAMVGGILALCAARQRK